MFNEIRIYEAKIEKHDEIEALMKEVAEFYLSLPGVIDVKYIKRTHRQKDFNAKSRRAAHSSDPSSRQGHVYAAFGRGGRTGSRRFV